MDDLRSDYGLLIYAADDASTETQRLREWLLSDLENLADEAAPADLVIARQRIASFIQIGTRCTGDPIVLDSSVTAPSGEHPVAIMDHELLLAAVLGELEDAHVDVIALLTAIDDDPCALLNDAWRYHGQDGRQYYVDSVDRLP